MFDEPKRITIFVGYFGSGKTETALNYALRLNNMGRAVTVVDLDLINPYFRIRQVKNRLEEMGIKVVSPAGKLANADIPALPPAIQGVLERPVGYGVFDVGGGGIGATVLGRFEKDLPAGAYELFLVVNTCRPYSRDTDSIISIVAEIEKSSRLKVSALVSNTNLGPETDASVILEGHRIISEAAKRLDIPVAFVSARSDLAEAMGETDVPVLPLTLFMKTPWQQ